MAILVQLRIKPEFIYDDFHIKEAIKDQLKWKNDDFSFIWKKRSIDARKPQIFYNCTLEVFQKGECISENPKFEFKNVENSKALIIIGVGPAGLYAGLRCLELGIKPIIYERGKDVRSRRRDLAVLNKTGIVNPDSNYCFGEGGAGTYSDGKLYTRSKKRGDVDKVLQLFVHFGAEDSIAVDAHPHIGTNKLPQIIVSMREQIINSGGEVHFNSKVTDFLIEDGGIKKIQINQDNWIDCEDVIIATGHSARDMFNMLHDNGVRLESKSFALGVRVEHTQALIDKIQYHGRLNDDYLPPASYALVEQVEDRGVYSFCMCPGGIIAPCATNDNEVVTNGWSPSKRNNIYSNSGIVVAIHPDDFSNSKQDPFVCLNFQQSIEQKAYQLAGGQQKVPAQRLLDFVNGVQSKDFPRSSYVPGITSVNFNELLPPFVLKRLKKAFVLFDKKMKGFLTNDAVIHGPESRTSSPILIPRNPETMEHPEVSGIFPCAEGAGYAGGIVSAAIDGMKCVDAIAYKWEMLNQK
jgi:uncharacterized FAD-dependent dehydrogenase